MGWAVPQQPTTCAHEMNRSQLPGPHTFIKPTVHQVVTESPLRDQRAPPSGLWGGWGCPSVAWVLGGIRGSQAWAGVRHLASGRCGGPMNCALCPPGVRRRPGRGWTALPDSIRQKDPGLTVSGKTPIAGCGAGGLACGGPSNWAQGQLLPPPVLWAPREWRV